MRYRAFFSYARADDRIANWLHRQLDGYRTPTALVGIEGELGPVPAKLHPIFRDRTDLESGGHVDAALQQALEDSETLIVLCTPTSAKSHWVNHEVETFLKLGREVAIFPVIADGIPDSVDSESECFPPALRGKGLLAADLREIKLPTGQLLGDGREGGRLKLIAGLLGVKLDALVQRERRRQRQVVAVLGAAALVFAGVAAAAGGFWWLSNKRANTIAQQTDQIAAERDEANRQRDEAQRQRDEATKQRSIADQKTEEALDNFEEAKRQTGLASENARQAQSTLLEQFAERARERFQAGDLPGAARYALAGHVLAREAKLLERNGERYRTWLGATMQGSGAVKTIVFQRDVIAIGYTSKGPRALVRGTSNTLQVWDLNSGQPLITLPAGREVWSAAFSSDGDRVVTGDSHPGRGRVWDTSTGQLLLTLSGHRRTLYRPSFSSDGSRIVTGSEDGTARVWDARSGELLHSLEVRRDSISAELSRDGLRIVTGGESTAVWDARTGERLFFLKGGEDLRLPSFSPDGTLIVTTGYNAARGQVAQVWNAQTGEPVLTFSGHEDSVRSVAFLPDGERVITGSWDDTVRVWNVRTGRLLAVFPDHGANVDDVATSPDGAFIIASGEKIVRIWDTRVTQAKVTLSQHQGNIRDVRFSRDGSRLVTASSDRTAAIWDGITGERILTLSGHDRGVSSADFSPDGTRVISGSGDGSARVWDSQTGKLLLTLAGHDETTGVLGVGYSSNGAQVFTRGERSLLVREALTGRILAQIRGGPQSSRGGFAISPDALRVVARGPTSRAEVRDIRTDQVLLTLTGHSGDVRSAAFSSDGSMVATGSQDKTARIWDGRTGRQLLTLSGTGAVSDVGFSEEGSLIVTKSFDFHSEIAEIRVWDILSGLTLYRLTGSDAANAYSARFSPDGRSIVTGGADGIGRVYDTRRLMLTLQESAIEACLILLAPSQRRFTSEEMADRLLGALWPADRDVCEGVPSVASLSWAAQ